MASADDDYRVIFTRPTRSYCLAVIRQRRRFAFGVSASAAILLFTWSSHATQPPHYPRGFDTSSLIVIGGFADDDGLPPELKLTSKLRGSSLVVSATLSDRTPGSLMNHTVKITAPNTGELEQVFLKEVVGSFYFETYRIEPLAGRLLTTAISEDDRAGETDGDRILAINTVISAKAASALGYDAPGKAIGHVFYVQHRRHRTVLTIVGVVQDVLFGALTEKVRPLFYILDSQPFRDAQTSVRYSGQATSAIKALQSTWEHAVPGVPFMASTMQELLAAAK